MSAVYNFYEDGFFVGDEKVNLTYVCKYCKEKGIKNKDGSQIIVKSTKGTTSNLIGHLAKSIHPHLYEEFKNAKNITPVSKKRSLFPTSEKKTPTLSGVKRSLLFNSGVTFTSKYAASSYVQKQRLVFINLNQSNNDKKMKIKQKNLAN